MVQQSELAISTGARLGFGARVGTVIQTAYVVADVRQAIQWWIDRAGIGPWFLLDHFLQPDQRYRGAPATADVAIAMSFAGGMNIELIQPLDDNPSVYRETVRQRGFGFHHIGVAVEDVDAAIAAQARQGYQLAFRANVPTGGAVAYLDDGVNDPGFLELIPATAGMDATFTRFWQAAGDWDGSDPIRAFA